MKKKQGKGKDFIIRLVFALFLLAALLGIYSFIRRMEKTGSVAGKTNGSVTASSKPDKNPSPAPGSIENTSAPADNSPGVLAKLYKEFNLVERGGKIDEIRKYISKEHQHVFDKMNEERKEKEGASLAKNAPTEYMVVKEIIDGDNGCLYLEGNATSFFNGKPAPYGKMTFRLESGKWKLYNSHWAEKKEQLDLKNGK